MTCSVSRVFRCVTMARSIPMRDDGAELALLWLRLARHLDLAKPERGARIDFQYGHNRFSPIWEPPPKRRGILTQGSITQLPMECNRIIWHINKHNVAHYLYYYGTIYILMWHINIYNMPQYIIYCATLIQTMCHINLFSSHRHIDTHPYQETPSHVT